MSEATPNFAVEDLTNSNQALDDDPVSSSTSQQRAESGTIQHVGTEFVAAHEVHDNEAASLMRSHQRPGTDATQPIKIELVTMSTKIGDNALEPSGSGQQGPESARPLGVLGKWTLGRQFSFGFNIMGAVIPCFLMGKSQSTT